MAVEFKIAISPKEIDDALWLRHEVYVTEEGRYGGKPLPDERIVDRFDVIPKVAHILAYDGNVPVAGMRVNCDMGMGLPPDSSFDFGHVRPTFGSRLADWQTSKPIVACGGMLVVRKAWRQRRDVTLSLYRLAASVFYSWEVTHIIAAVSKGTTSLYPRMGFVPLAGNIWIDTIKDHVVPMIAKSEDCFRWAFGPDGVPHEPIWQERRRPSCPGCSLVNSSVIDHRPTHTRGDQQKQRISTPGHPNPLQ